MSLWALVCATILITSQNKEQILAGRCLNYFYTGMELSVITVYQSEIMPPAIRGFAVGSYQMSIVSRLVDVQADGPNQSVGHVIMSIVCHFTSQLTTSKAWRIPFGLYYISPAIVASGIWFLPESPRFCLSKGREEEARRGLTRLRVNNSPEAIDSEVEVIKLGLAAHEAQEKGTYADLFRGVARRRTLIAMLAGAFIQWSGQSLNSNYGPVFVKQIGTVAPFNYTIIVSCCQLLGTLTAMYFLDVVGRRPMMVTGISCQCIFMFMVAGIGSIKGSPEMEFRAGVAVVAFVILFAVAFSTGWAPAAWVTIAEISDQRLRDKTQRVGAWTNIVSKSVPSPVRIAIPADELIVSCAVTFMIPYLIGNPANLSTKVGYIFGSLCAIGAVLGFRECFSTLSAIILTKNLHA